MRTRLIINSNLTWLLEFPQITKDKPKTLKQFIVHIRTHLKALEVFGQSVNQWCSIVIYLARNRLDYYSQREWEEVVGQQEHDHIPTVEEFLKFLNKRSRTFEMLGSNKMKQEVMRHAGKKGGRQIALSLTAQVCPICKESHPIYNCAEFLKKNRSRSKSRGKEKTIMYKLFEGRTLC